MKPVSILSLCASLLLLPGTAPGEETGTRRHLTLPTPVALEVPESPTPVKMNGRQCLVYELHITNFFTNRLELVRLEVLGDGTTPPLASYTGEELTRQMAHAGYWVVALSGGTVPPDQLDERVIGPGLRAVIFLLIATKGTDDVPKFLRHRLYFKPTVLSGGEKDNVIDGAQVTVNRRRPVVLGAPLRGEGWLAAGGLSNMSYHRRVITALGGKARIPQRFATDWAKLGADGSSFHGERANTNFYGYGAEVLAVADAVVAEVRDGIPENLTADDREVPLTLETAGGNSVVLDLGKGNFAWYAHLKPQSVRVRLGEKVRRGQVLARLGNSGNSFSPHLHFHVMNGRSPLASEGVPYVFESFEVQGVVPSGEPGNWKPPPNAKSDKRQREIPIENAVIRFP
jgi:murein DD-endopeptidase